MIIGIDTKSAGVAMCAMHTDGTFYRVKALNIKSKGKSQPEILHELYSYVLKHISSHDRVYVEEPVYVQNRQTVIKLSAAFGAVLAAIGAKEATAVTVPVSLWKMHTVGHGNASKSDVSQWLHSLHDHHYTQCAGDQDAVDASCIAIYGVSHTRMTGHSDRGNLLHQAAPAQDS